MLLVKRTIFSLFIAMALALALALPAYGKEMGSDGASPSFFVETTFGLSTYKSKMLNSNDTGTGLVYALGGYAGEEREFGMRYKADTTTVAFELNESELAATWEDTTLRYRWGPLYLGPVFGHVLMKATKESVDYIDLAGSGTGANAGVIIPVGKIGTVNLDYTTVTMAAVKNSIATTGEVSLGARSDIDISGVFNLTDELLDFIFGYQTRAYSVSAGESFAEAYSITYGGLRLSLYF